jgi:hypothetical protein
MQAPGLRFQEDAMKTLTFATGLLLAAAAAVVQADNLSANVNLGGNAAEHSAAFGVTHIEQGSFVDTFTFTPSSGSFFVDASLLTLGFTPTTDVNFDFATINGNSMTLTGSGVFEYGFLLPTSISGPLVLTVIGNVNGAGATGPASASYSGTLNISPVPEPAGYAMLLAGLGLAGVAGRRRGQAAGLVN